MDGPRSVKSEEFPSLSKLLDTVFRPGKTDEMFRLFPIFLSESNRENILVCAEEDGTLVSHVGLILRWASIEGCTVGVGGIGAVATYESHRGQGLASQLMELACRQSNDWGADFLMISGGRGLYRRLGAADVGVDTQVTVDPAIRERFRDPSISLVPAGDADLAACAALYATRPCRYLRPMDDWRTYLRAGLCMCKSVRTWMVRRGAAAVAYLVVAEHPQNQLLEVTEFAGDAAALAAALALLPASSSDSDARIHLEPGDQALRAILVASGAACKTVPTMGTMLILNLPRLMDRLQPAFRARLGRAYPHLPSVAENSDGSFTFSLGETEWTAPGKAEAAQFIFGHPQHQPRPGDFQKVFPISTLWYGFDYV